MAETTRKRVRRRPRRKVRHPPTVTTLRSSWTRGPDEPPWGPDDLDGGAGVREPRRPYPGTPAGALALDEPSSRNLDLVR